MCSSCPGVVHGCQAFGQAMVDQGTSAVIVNTGSKQGITMPPGDTAYNVSKSGVKTLTEGLQHTLREIPVRNTNLLLGVSVRLSRACLGKLNHRSSHIRVVLKLKTGRVCFAGLQGQRVPPGAWLDHHNDRYQGRPAAAGRGVGPKQGAGRTILRWCAGSVSSAVQVLSTS